MKHRTSKHPERGSTLMVTLFMVGLLSFFLFAYLYLVRTQRGFVARSQAWNAAMGMAEAGIEEALAQLNPGAPAPVIDRTANGWGAANGGIYGPVSRTLTNNGSYSVIYTTDTNPIIYSTGYVSVASIPATLARVVRVTTANFGLFRAALATKYNLDLKGNNIETDSFNSMNPALSTFGQYDLTKTSTNGDIASIGGIVNVGNATVNGSVLLGPTASETMNNGLITGGVTNDFNVEFPDVVLPTGNPPPAVQLAIPVVTNGASYDYAFFVGGYYSINNLKNSDSIYVAPNTTVTLLLTGNVTVNNVYVAWGGTNGTSGSLTIYMDGPSFSLAGNEIVDSGNALNFSYYGTTNNTSINFGGNSAFTGTIYAPEADFHMGGGGTTAYDFVGAGVVGSATMNGHFKFHYDENLGRGGPRSGYIATSWTEL
jgi:Tfp pilus assembly protein PilX